MEGIFPAWGRILSGYRPNLSIEITRECPLRCPGCYAYGADHLGSALGLRDLADLKGDALVAGVLDVVREHRPIHVSLVGGEPLVRYRELTTLLPKLADLGIHTQVVTSAVRPIPREWAGIRRLQICVSVDGLQPEHDARRAPATYDRIVKHIEGHAITVHCTVTRQQAGREGYLAEFAETWSKNPHVRQIWFSLYTPQVGEVADEILTPSDRHRVLAEIAAMTPRFPKLRAPRALLDVYADPPSSPDDCIFARTTTCLSADLERRIEPCQFGGTPDCSQCGCMASAGLGAVGRHRLPGGVEVGQVFQLSERVGRRVRQLRSRVAAAAMW
jgi:MoaA/NifB/PqqE/SkfB family radical SAM enzyme